MFFFPCVKNSFKKKKWKRNYSGEAEAERARERKEKKRSKKRLSCFFPFIFFRCLFSLLEMPFPRKSDDGVAFEMSASAPASQTSVSWPSEKARGQVPMPMRWSSEPKKRERKVRKR